MRDNRWTIRSREWQTEGVRSVGRPKRRWRDDIVGQQRAVWTRIAKDRERWRTRVEGYFLRWKDTACQFCITLISRAEACLSYCCHGSFSCLSPIVCNSLPSTLRLCLSLTFFKSKLTPHVFPSSLCVSCTYLCLCQHAILLDEVFI